MGRPHRGAGPGPDLTLRAEAQAHGTPDRPGALHLAAALTRLYTGPIREQLAAAEPGNTTYARDLSVSYNKLADLAAATGQAEEATRLYRQSLTIREQLAAAEPGNTTYARDLSVSYERLAGIAAEAEDQAEAYRLLTAAADARRGLRQREPSRVDLAEELAVSLALLSQVTDPDGANKILKEALDVLGPFERRAVLTRKGEQVLRWLRSQDD